MKERISRTAGNVYEKADKKIWMMFPKEKKYTSFVDATELIISEKQEDSDFDGISISDVIEHVRKVQKGD